MSANKPTAIIIGSLIGFIVVLCICILAFIAIFKTNNNPLDPVVVSEQETDDLESIIKNDNDPDICDDTTTDYFSFHGVEEVVVSYNPCKTMWLLAKEDHSYELTAPSGKTIYVTVWRDQANNVTASNSYTIRALDVHDNDAERDTTSIAIIRWVASDSDLQTAKSEVEKTVSKLDF